MTVATYWPANDPGKQGALCHILTEPDAQGRVKVKFYDESERWVPLSELEAQNND